MTRNPNQPFSPAPLLLGCLGGCSLITQSWFYLLLVCSLFGTGIYDHDSRGHSSALMSLASPCDSACPAHPPSPSPPDKKPPSPDLENDQMTHLAHPHGLGTFTQQLFATRSLQRGHLSPLEPLDAISDPPIHHPPLPAAFLSSVLDMFRALLALELQLPCS